MAETDPAGSRHEDQIQHVREVNNRQSSCGGIGEYREGMERRIGTLIGCHRMRIKAINESTTNVACHPIGEHNDSGYRRKGNRRNSVASEFTCNDAGMGSLGHRDPAGAC